MTRGRAARAVPLWKRLRSWRHALSLRISERLRWSRGTYHERPAVALKKLDSGQAARCAELRRRYPVCFERDLNVRTSLRNYEYLDLLDRAWAAWGQPRPSGGLLCDAGCASFWYAAALQGFFQPTRLVGVEIEGHRLFRNGYSRSDYARGYISGLEQAEFVVADYATYARPAALITAWFPFLTPAAILAWRLPLSLLAPDAFFASVRTNLQAGGLFLMVNHGPSEAQLALQRCSAAGLTLVGRWQEQAGVFSGYRLSPPQLSWWR